MKDKICFVSDANQENYIRQFNKKIESLPDDFDFDYYVSTTNSDMITNKYDKLKVFDSNEMMKRDHRMEKYEFLTKNMKLYFYPSNIRRHIINKAFEDGYDYVVWNDCDVKFNTTKENFINELKKYEINKIYTQCSIYRYGNNGNQSPFDNCDRVIEDFNNKKSKNDLKVHDGPVAVYYLDKQKQKDYIKTWDDVTFYGYEKPYSTQRGAERPHTEVYAILFNDIDVEYSTRRCFVIKHDSNVHY